jgi:hypothetical protein
MAEFRAKSIHNNTNPKSFQLIASLLWIVANENPSKAKGKANIVCENLTSEK